MINEKSPREHIRKVIKTASSFLPPQEAWILQLESKLKLLNNNKKAEDDKIQNNLENHLYINDDNHAARNKNIFVQGRDKWTIDELQGNTWIMWIADRAQIWKKYITTKVD